MISAFEAALEKASVINPVKAAKNCGFNYEGTQTEGVFTFNLLNRTLKLSFPDFDCRTADTGKKINQEILIIIMYHLAKSDGFQLSNNWISYAGLPDGWYANVMRGYTSNRLLKHYGNDIESLQKAADSLEAESFKLSADLSLKFNLLPMVPIGLFYWMGDEEFPARADFMFDESAAHHLASDCYAILCSLLTSALISQNPSPFFTI